MVKTIQVVYRKGLARLDESDVPGGHPAILPLVFSGAFLEWDGSVREIVAVGPVFDGDFSIVYRAKDDIRVLIGYRTWAKECHDVKVVERPIDWPCASPTDAVR